MTQELAAVQYWEAKFKEQADRIAELENSKLNVGGEPFIWMDDCGTWFANEAYKNLDKKLKDGLFPLYTTPQTKPLSDEEIQKLWKGNIESCGWDNVFNFARAIEAKVRGEK